MVRKLVTAAVSAALCAASIMPGVAAAQDYRYSGYEAPGGVTATVNLRVPLGREHARPSYGVTLGFGQTLGGPVYDGRTVTRSVNLADLRFNGDRLSNARLAGFDLANLDRDRRMSLAGGGKKTWLLIGAIIGAAVVICVAADCFDGDETDTPN